jgi:hypothetical protein
MHSFTLKKIADIEHILEFGDGGIIGPLWYIAEKVRTLGNPWTTHKGQNGGLLTCGKSANVKT